MNRLFTNPMDFINLFLTDNDIDPSIDSNIVYKMPYIMCHHIKAINNGRIHYLFKLTTDGDYMLIGAGNTSEPLVNTIPFSHGFIHYGIVPYEYMDDNKNCFDITQKEVREFIVGFISNIMHNNKYIYAMGVFALAANIKRYYSDNYDDKYYTEIYPELFKLYEKLDIYYNIHDYIFNIQLPDENHDIATEIWNVTNLGNAKREYPILIYSLHGSPELMEKFTNNLGKAMCYIDIMNPGKSTMTEHLIYMMNNSEYEAECVFILSNNNPDDKKAIAENNNLADAIIRLEEIEDGKIRITVVHRKENPIIMDIDFDDEMAPYHLMSINPAVKDAFNAKHKNGIPTSIEEYKASPMGNPVPIVVDEPMRNRFIVPPISI